jgi:PLAT/LH2 domain
MSVQYTVVVQTGSVPNAGTDANVYVNIIGTVGQSGERFIDNADDNFENSKIDTFAVDARELGTLRRVHIRHDNTGNKPGWFLDRITVRREDTGEEAVFPCGHWLARDEEDGRIDRVLSTSGVIDRSRDLAPDPA